MGVMSASTLTVLFPTFFGFFVEHAVSDTFPLSPCYEVQRQQRRNFVP